MKIPRTPNQYHPHPSLSRGDAGVILGNKIKDIQLNVQFAITSYAINTATLFAITVNNNFYIFPFIFNNNTILICICLFFVMSMSSFFNKLHGVKFHSMISST